MASDAGSDTTCDATPCAATLQSVVEIERALLERILGSTMGCAADFGRTAAVSRDFQCAAAAGMDWRASYLSYPHREPRVPWIVMASHGDDQTKWRVRHRLRVLFRAGGAWDGEWQTLPKLDCNSPRDISLRLEAVLNGRFILPLRYDDAPATEGPKMCKFLDAMEHARPSDHEIRTFWTDSYGCRTSGVLIWSETGDFQICDPMWKVQSLEECYAYESVSGVCSSSSADVGPGRYAEGEEPLPFEADWAQVDPSFCENGAFHLDDRAFWMTTLFFALLRRTGYPHIDAALEVLFDRTRANGGRLPRCGHCGARGPGRLRRCARCKSAWYCDRAHQVAAWPRHKRDCAS